MRELIMSDQPSCYELYLGLWKLINHENNIALSQEIPKENLQLEAQKTSLELFVVYFIVIIREYRLGYLITARVISSNEHHPTYLLVI